MSGSAAGRRKATSDLVVVAVLALVLPLAAWWRLDDVTRRTVWAEDGERFLGERLEVGGFEALFFPYEGYLHLVPRILTDLALGLAPLSSYALAMTMLCCITVGLVGVAVYVCSHAVVASRWARILLASLTVLVPPAPIEALGNAANIHWYFLWLTPWLLLARPTRRWHSVALALLMLAATLTEILTVLFLPLVLWRVRDRYRWPVTGTMVVGLTAQIVVTVTHPRGASEYAALGLMDMVKGYLLNVVLAIWNTSIEGPGSLFARHGWSLAVLALLPFLVLAVVMLLLALRDAGVVSGPRTGRDWSGTVLLSTLVVGATAPLFVAFVVNPDPAYTYDSFSLAELAAERPRRYGVAPALFLLAIPVCAADMLARSGLRWGRPIGVAIGASVLVLMCTQFTVDGTERSDGPAWAKQVAAARRACVADPGPKPILLAPTADWVVVLDCDLLLE